MEKIFTMKKINEEATKKINEEGKKKKKKTHTSTFRYLACTITLLYTVHHRTTFIKQQNTENNVAAGFSTFAMWQHLISLCGKQSRKSFSSNTRRSELFYPQF